jgi:hypothetical protein
MGLINFLKQHAAGATQGQAQRRYERASNRSTEYMQVVQWYLESAEGMPTIVADYQALSQLSFRQEHRATLIGYRNDITRKMGHAAHIGATNNPYISAFLRPSDGTVFCAYVLLRDDNQQFAVMKPYWFLSKGEKEADYRSEVVEVISPQPINVKSGKDRTGLAEHLAQRAWIAKLSHSG